MTTETTYQLVEINGDWIAVRMTIDQAEQGEDGGLWTARGTVRVLSLAAAKRESVERR